MGKVLDIGWERLFMTKISVIIPVYNVEKYLVRCLESVLAQTFTDFEVICINDGSRDKSLEILEKYAEKDKRIKVYNQSNQGVAVARNNGLKKATGGYVFFLDSDDVLHYQCFEILIKLVEEFNVDMISFNQLDCEFDDVNKKQLDKEKIDVGDKDVLISDKPIFLGTHRGEFITHFTVTSKFCKKKILNGIKFISGNYFEDMPYSFAVLAKNPRTLVLKKVLYYHIINYEGLSLKESSVKQIRDYGIGIDNICELYKNNKKELEFLKKDFIPNVLEQQRRRCRKADRSIKKEAYSEFAYTLRTLYEKNMLVRKYHKLHRWLIYRSIMFIY